MSNEPIAIIGTACRFAGGVTSPAALWDLLESPRDVQTRIPESRFNTDGYYHKDGTFHGHTAVQHMYSLDQHPGAFDAQFFQIKPVEARAIDPQQRILLELVYEATEAAGLSIEKLKGTKTGVYVGQMCNDHEHLVYTDISTMPTYCATGTSRALASNRISYFFDWRGPSLTLDTACSSSLYCLHLATQALRTGDATTAVVCGTNVLISPNAFAAESNLNMLSPDGRSRMWDANANGYARGEGVAVVVVKTLRAALEDGDHIECVIRETGVNQDGATPGITVPDARSQADLIRETYHKAGLDLTLKRDRPQFFEAHGTGTPTGDPIEAEAIQATMRLGDAPPLYVGSIKTVLGHTESTAGVAGVLKAMLALQHSVIPPNMLFTQLSPKVAPFSTGLTLPVARQPWPVVHQDDPRRASVNSFGFGGANGHVILESYDDPSPRQETASRGQPFGPYVFSAGTERALLSILKSYSEWAESPRGLSSDPRDLAWTLRSRRSVHSVRAVFPAGSIAQLKASIDTKLAKAAEGSSIGLLPMQRQPRILAIFSGQGAQSPRMAAELVESSPLAQRTMHELEQSLAQLPSEHRPTWSLTQELLAAESTSRLHLAELAQPLSTAVQILIVDMLRAAGTVFHGTIGHSSGEIGAAYAAGFLTAKDAIRIAYYRGLGSKFATSPNGSHIKGAMLAVGTGMEDAEELLQEPEFQGRVCIAASNSSSSITLSGDEPAIMELEEIYEDEKKFRRRLKVDMAYHSAHMQPCADKYVQWLQNCDIRAQEGSCIWQSTVYENRNMNNPKSLHALGAAYWADNLTNPVRFSQGLRKALETNSYDLVVEIGPHPTLKGPVMQTIKEAGQSSIIYQGTLQRNVNAIHSMSDALGLLWSYHEFPQTAIRLDEYEKAASGNDDHRLLTGLPSYPWDHSRLHWHSPRFLRKLIERADRVHPLLGHADKDSSAHQMRWRHILRTKQIPWLADHRLQGITVFPAAGYLSSLLEACQVALPLLSGHDTKIGLFETTDFVVHRAIVFSDAVEESEEGGIEVTIELLDIVYEEENGDGQFRARFVYSAGVDKQTGDLSLVASSNVLVHFGPQTSDMLLHTKPPVDRGLVPVEKSVFYESMAQIGYGYTGSFQGAGQLQRSLGKSEAVLGWDTLEHQQESGLLVHPAVLDTAIQMLALAYSYPYDGRLWSLFVPVRIDCLRIHLDRYTAAGKGIDAGEAPLTMTTVNSVNDGDDLALAGDADIYAGQYLAIQMQGGKLAPFANASEADDVKMWAHMRWAPMDVRSPDLSSGTDKVASALATLSHRYPRMSILELGSGNGATMKSVIDRTGIDGLQRYTFTAASPDILNQVREQLGQSWIKTTQNRVSFRTLDPSNDASSQGIQASSFDSIVAGPLSLNENNLEKSLRDLRVLLRPGGFLVLSVLPTHGVPIPKQQEDWNVMLKTCGFSDIDALAVGDEDGVSVLVSQAVDDHINRLRHPLSSSDVPAITNDVLVVGGAQHFVDELKAILSPHTRLRVHRVASLSSAGPQQLASAPIVISLTDLDKHLFKNIPATEFNGLKAMLSLEKTILWVTRNRRQGNPWANLTTAFLRTARRELPEMRLQTLDFEGHGEIDAAAVAQSILSLLLSQHASVPTPGAGPLLSLEPEIIIDESRRWLIPRFESMPEADHRYNSARRKVLVDTQPEQTAVRLNIDANFRAGFSILPPELASELRSDMITLTSSYSVVRAIDTPVGPRFLTLGAEVETQRTYLSLEGSLASIYNLPRDNATLVPLEMSSLRPDTLLSLFASELWSAAILDRMQPSQRLLLHNPPHAIASTILRNAAKHGIQVSITCADTKTARSESWTYIEPHMPLRSLKKLLSPESISSCIIFGNGKGNEKLLLSCIPHHCYVRIVKSATTPGHQPVSNTSSNAILNPIIAQAMNRVISRLDTLADKDKKVSALEVEDLLDSSTLRNADSVAIMQWPKGAVSASVSRLDDAGHMLFSSKKSYWLLGLTSGLGLGICDWMIATGARNIVLSSRSGQVETSWLQKHLRNGVIIRVVPCDITSRSAVEQAYAEILSDTALPPLRGVMNGAALFRDRPIREMSLAELNAVLRPKVDGSLHLDSVLASCPLDFFVMFSSMVGVVGNVGQANYCAANAFMSALATDRRRRGLPGSAISIGAVIGAGYMAREFGDERTNAFAEMSGVRACSEVDVHQFLAEAIFGPECKDHGVGDLSRETDLGLAMVGKNNAAFKPNWHTDPTFSRFHPEEDEDEQGAASQAKSNGTVKDRLQSSKTASDVAAVVSEEVLAKLRALLQLDGSADDATLLRQKSSHMGIDSLVAVELRSWIIKTFQVSIPVLEMLEGIAISDLVERISQQIPEKMVPILHGGSPEPVEQIKSATSPAPRGTDTPPMIKMPPVPATAGTAGPSETRIDSPQRQGSEASSCDDLEKSWELVQPVSTAPLSSRSVIRTIDLSFAQATFWFIHSVLRDKTVLNHTSIFRLTGKEIRLDSFKTALRAVSGRHEVLRTCVVEQDGKFLQGILERSPLEVEVRHITRGIAEAQEIYLAVKRHVFDLASGDVMRIVLLTTDSPTENYVITSVHHLANDGFCMPLFLRDLEAAYNDPQLKSRRWESSSVKQYGDYTIAQQNQWKSGAWNADLAYWKEQFVTIPEPLPLRRALITNRKPLDEYGVHSVDIDIAQDLADQIRRVASAKGATSFHFYFAAFRLLLYRMLFQGERSFASTAMCIGTADAHRTDEADWESMGPYMSLLPIHFPQQEQGQQGTNPVSFESLLEDARSQSLGALRHAAPAFDIILDHLHISRTAEHSPLFQAFIDYRQGWSRKHSLMGTTCELLEFQPALVPYDLSLDVIDNAPSGEGATVTLMGQTALYDANTVSAFARCYEDILRHAVDDPQFDVESNEWDFRQEDIQNALELGSGTSFQPTWPGTLIHQFMSVSNGNLQKLAISTADGSLSLSYLQLRDRVACIGRALGKAGISTGDRVVVYQHPTADQVSSMLAVMAVGAIYIPFDPTQHSGRLQAMVTDCKPSALLVDANTRSAALDFKAPSAIVVLDVSTLSIDCVSSQTLDVKASSTAPAMILYTSGTSGTPKGVLLSHASWAAKVEADGAFYGLDGKGVVLQQSACGFDMAVLQAFAALAFGGTLCLIPQAVRGDSEAVSRAIVEYGVTFTCATPTEYRSWLRHGSKIDLQQSAWVVALSGGEAAVLSLFQAFSDLGKRNLRLFNGYGPTETTYCSSRQQLDYAGSVPEVITAGRACPNETIYIVDERMHLLPVGMIGEIVIGGVGVSMGYFGDANHSPGAFVRDTFSAGVQKGPNIMYRTKDRGRLLPNGALSIEGRIGQDTLIKLRGVRIELQDIEQTIIRSASDIIAEAVVSVRSAGGDSAFLVAHVVFASNDGQIEAASIPSTAAEKKAYLANLLKTLPLPRNMRPSCLIPIDRLPMTVSGKLDRQAAARLPAITASTDDAPTRSLSEHEHTLKEMWLKLLLGPNYDSQDEAHGIDIQPATDFFHVGGTSMLLVELKARIRKELGVSLDLIQLFEGSTLEAMARLVGKAPDKANTELAGADGTVMSETGIDWEGEADFTPTHSLQS